MGSGRESNCSKGLPVDFYWYGCDDPDGHLAAANAALMVAIDGPTRRWNPYNSAMVRAEFRGRLRLAAEGRLVPVEQVKPIDQIAGAQAADLYEIRWRDLAITEQEGGVVRYLNIEVRLLHAEPVRLGVAAVGLHAHEKLVFPGDAARTKMAQDDEIREALRRYNEGFASAWGALHG